MHCELLGTWGCHLCTEVSVWLPALCAAEARSLRFVDIAEQEDSEALIARYGLRIPVLRCGSRELDFPFDADAVRDFLRTLPPTVAG